MASRVHRPRRGHNDDNFAAVGLDEPDRVGAMSNVQDGLFFHACGRG